VYLTPLPLPSAYSSRCPAADS